MCSPKSLTQTFTIRLQKQHLREKLWLVSSFSVPTWTLAPLRSSTAAAESAVETMCMDHEPCHSASSGNVHPALCKLYTGHAHCLSRCPTKTFCLGCCHPHHPFYGHALQALTNLSLDKASHAPGPVYLGQKAKCNLLTPFGVTNNGVN